MINWFLVPSLMQDRGSNVAGLFSLLTNLSSAPGPALLDPGCADREKNKMYYSIQRSFYCFQRLYRPASAAVLDYIGALKSKKYIFWAQKCTYRQLIFIWIEDFIQVTVGHSQVVLMDEAGWGWGFAAWWTLTICAAKQTGEEALNKTPNSEHFI